jgi:hypothetical protein
MSLGETLLGKMSLGKTSMEKSHDCLVLIVVAIFHTKYYFDL